MPSISFLNYINNCGIKAQYSMLKVQEFSALNRMVVGYNHHFFQILDPFVFLILSQIIYQYKEGTLACVSFVNEDCLIFTNSVGFSCIFLHKEHSKILCILSIGSLHSFRIQLNISIGLEVFLICSASISFRTLFFHFYITE